MDLRQTVTDAGRGDRAAVEELLARFLPGVERHLARHAGGLIRAKESASDLAQSVCREVLERLADERLEYQGEAAFKQWLYQAALHKLQNRGRHYRADKRDAGREAVTPLEELAQAPTTASMHAIRNEESEQVRDAMARLPDRDRRIIELVHFEQKSHQEAAAELGITDAHSRVLLARALARLARLAGRPE